MNIKQWRPWASVVLGLLVVVTAEMQLGSWIAVLGILVAALALWTIFDK